MGSVNMYDPTTGQLRRIVGNDNHLRDEMVAEYELNSTASHAYSKDDQLIYNETLYTATKNIAIGDELSTEGISTWESKTWDGLKPLSGNRIWTDGDDVYYSDGSSKQYVLNQDTLTWETMTWNGLTNFSAINIWTDGTNTYFSNDSNQYVLNKATHTWEEKSWTGLTDFVGQYIWTDSGNIYYLEKTDWYVLDKNTNSWSAITWSAPTYFYGYHIWSDGENVYHSNNSEQYVLNRTTNKWTSKTWTGSLTSFDGNYVWEKDGSIYYSYGSNQYVFDKSLGEWVSTTWTGLNSFNGDDIWINKGTYYCSEGGNAQYVFVTSEGNIQPSLSITEQLANAGSGGGGHTILDEDGVIYPQRSKLQFEGCEITDDAVNGITVVKCEGGGTTIVQKPTVTIDTYTYDGTEKAPVITGLDTKNCNVTGTYEATNAGDYTFTITLKNTANMVWNDLTTASLVYTWSIGKVIVTEPSVTNTSKTYNGSVQSPTITRDTDHTTISGTYSSTNVGSYSFEIALSDKENYMWTDGTDADKTYSWSIDAISVTVPTVTGTTKTYNGSAQSPTITRDTANTFVSGTTSATKVKSNYSFSIALNDTTYHKWSDNTTAAKSYTWKINPPVGSQYTPVNNIQAWLACASINKSYTTIAQVLEDATTLSALMLSNNAVDYLVRSTSWVSNITGNQTAMTDIGASDYCADTLLANSTWRTAICDSAYFEEVLTTKVPIMTSNTAPSGTAFADSIFDSSYAAYRMFAGMSGHGWSPDPGGTHRCGYQFPSPITVYKVAGALAPGANYATTPATVACQGSNNGSSWTAIPMDSVQFKNVNSFTYTNINSLPPQYTYISFYGTFDNKGQGYRAQIWGR